MICSSHACDGIILVSLKICVSINGVLNVVPHPNSHAYPATLLFVCAFPLPVCDALGFFVKLPCLITHTQTCHLSRCSFDHGSIPKGESGFENLDSEINSIIAQLEDVK